MNVSIFPPSCCFACSFSQVTIKEATDISGLSEGKPVFVVFEVSTHLMFSQFHVYSFMYMYMNAVEFIIYAYCLIEVSCMVSKTLEQKLWFTRLVNYFEPLSDTILVLFGTVKEAPELSLFIVAYLFI